MGFAKICVQQKTQEPELSVPKRKAGKEGPKDRNENKALLDAGLPSTHPLDSSPMLLFFSVENMDRTKHRLKQILEAHLKVRIRGNKMAKLFSRRCNHHTLADQRGCGTQPCDSLGFRKAAHARQRSLGALVRGSRQGTPTLRKAGCPQRPSQQSPGSRQGKSHHR